MRIAARWQSHVLQLLAEQSNVLLQAGDLFLLAEDREIQRFQQVFHLGQFDFYFGQACVHRFFHIDMRRRIFIQHVRLWPAPGTGYAF